jgi:poly(3-hydroxybutyrate) depolymerase
MRLVEETESVPAMSGRHGYTRTALFTPQGDSVIESYLVDEMGHAYPGPAGEGLFTDQAGPDASAIAWDFAKRHPKR